MRRLWGLLVGQERSIANARSAAGLMSARHVEREEVELFLREHLERGGRHRTA
ncbi:MAG: hypothetical protein QOF53_1161 [Nocardioidaceae bacterium]|nr:hypothetical protein [Nocardioidaceae bacterium]